MAERLTLEQLRAEWAASRKPKPKYGAQKCVLDGITFDSRREGRRYRQLRLLEQAGQIRELELQPRYVIHALGGGEACAYIADFRYVDVTTGHVVVEDAKGVRTAVYRLKRKFILLEYGITVREV